MLMVVVLVLLTLTLIIWCANIANFDELNRLLQVDSHTSIEVMK